MLDYKRPSEKVFRSIKFSVERFLIRGPLYQVLFIGGLIGIISLVFGQLLVWGDPAEDELGKSAWWAFLRMSDPGYLGDDNGTYRRVLSTILTILGYVLFMGSLVAIMTQWLYKTMKELEAGLTPMSTKGHITILDYTNRTPIIIGQILASEGRLNRFLKKIKRSGPTIAILNDIVGYELTADLKDNLPKSTDIKQVIFRTGDSIDSDDLGRVNVEHSSVVIIPSSIFENDRGFNSDISMIKSLLSIKNRAENRGVTPPKIVAEILDDKLKETAKSVYGEQLDLISSRALVARMISQNIHNPGLSKVYSELMSQDFGSEIYIKRVPEVEGLEWRQVFSRFENSLPIGIVSLREGKNIKIAPAAGEKINSGDLIVFVATDFESIVTSVGNDFSGDEIQPIETADQKVEKAKKKLLIMGWSEKTIYVIRELLRSESLDFSIDILSIHDVNEREKLLRDSLEINNSERLKNIQLDYTQLETFKEIDIKNYDNILFMTNDWIGSIGEADARSILGVLQLRKQEEIEGVQSTVLVELGDPVNEKLFRTRPSETIISPVVISTLLANIALRSELSLVFDELFNSEGAHITFKPASFFGFSGNLTFKGMAQRLRMYKDIPIGLRNNKTNTYYINPPGFQEFSEIEAYDIILLG